MKGNVKQSYEATERTKLLQKTNFQTLLEDKFNSFLEN